MANLSIRNLDDDTYERLRLRAAKHGVSTEEEIRRILRRAAKAPNRLGDYFISRFGPRNSIELELPDRAPHEPLQLD